ncbi:TPA: PTS sugar transporter subunit IIC [Salmonella enterica subsp. enterica]|nr:PTS sugar transporter subunit IIC [Salmonella enterica]
MEGVQTMFAKFIDVIQTFLTEPAILIGILVGVGYALDKKTPIKIITGMISAMVGLMMVLFGGFQFSAAFKPVAEAVSKAYGVHGYLMDSYAMKAATQIALGDNFGYVGYVFVLAFFTNLLLVLFGRYTGAKGIFLTGNTGVSHSQAVLWLIVFWLGFGWVQSIVIAGVLTGVFWAFSTTLIVKPIAKVTNNAGFTIAHNQMLGLWFFSKFAHKFGDPEKHDAENLKLPGWLAIFNHNVTAIAIVMTLFVGGFLLATGIDNVQLMAKGKPWYIYIINLGLQFSMYMVILLQGVRMMVGEINGSFKGWQDRFIPNAIPAVDVAALLPFSPNAATLGFVFCTFGTIFSMGILLLIHSPIMVLPGFVPLFFSGGPIGVLANRMGGYRSVIICTFLLGIIQTFGTVWAIPLTGLAKEGVGWTGIFDWATLWPAICELLKFIASTFHLGPYSI